MLFNVIFDERLVFPPVTELKNVLDCGYGAASWAIEVAEAYPSCEVFTTAFGLTALELMS